MTTNTFLTPPEVALRWRVSAEKVVAMIRGGQLAAMNVASAKSSRPRFRISVQAVQDFEHGRAAIVAPVPRAEGTRRSKQELKLQRFI
jgi:hypothetical protein